MGIINIPFYGKALGESIEDLEEAIEAIKTNKYDKEDLVNLVEAANAVTKAVVEQLTEDDENED